VPKLSNLDDPFSYRILSQIGELSVLFEGARRQVAARAVLVTDDTYSTVSGSFSDRTEPVGCDLSVPASALFLLVPPPSTIHSRLVWRMNPSIEECPQRGRAGATVIFSIRAQFGPLASAPPIGGPSRILVCVCKVGALGSMFSQQPSPHYTPITHQSQ